VPSILSTRGGSSRIEASPRPEETVATEDEVIEAQSAELSNKTTTTSSLPAWKRGLPPSLQSKGNKTLQKLTLGGVEIYLLGTAHVSNDSSADVQQLLNCITPDAIFVELCEARIPLLEGDATPDSTNTTDLSFWDKLDSIQQAQGGSRLQALSTVLLTSVQEDYAKELGVELGGEFRAAYQYWQKAANPTHLILGDRPLHLTLIRAWESLWWWPKIKVMVGLLWSCVQKPKPEEIKKWLDSVLQEESDVLTESLNDLAKHFPSLHKTIISERDAWLAAKLVQSCRVLAGNHQRQTMVAIVGAGHVPGICQWLTNTTSSRPPEAILQELSTTRRWAKDETVQQEMIPKWVNEVTQLQDMPDGAWMWAESVNGKVEGS